MIWAYYDESGEYDALGNILNMTVGGCVSAKEKWDDFTIAWTALLKAEGLSDFHMAPFQAWKKPFDFKLADGSRDKERHNRIMNAVLDIMLKHIDAFYGYAAVSAAFPEREKSHEILMDDCICGAVKDAVLRIWTEQEQPIHLVFGKQNHISADMIERYCEFYDYGEAQGRIRSIEHQETSKVPALQAADVLAYELARVQREGRPKRYPWQRLVDGAKKGGKQFSMTWGPIRSKRTILSGCGTAWGGALRE